MVHPDNNANSKSAPKIWVVTDGKAGDEVQCFAVASALTDAVEKRVVAPRAPWSWMAPWGPIDPRDHPNSAESPIRGTLPDIVIASGRRAIPYARKVKVAGAGRTKLVFLKDPRMNHVAADFIWAPTHDRLSGTNVFSTLTSPHEVTAKIIAARNAPAMAIADLPRPLLGVLLGGPSRGARYDSEDARNFATRLQSVVKNFASIAVTPSRRTPAKFLQDLREGLSIDNLFVWDGSGENPYHDILAGADALVVAADSHNMMSEALASGTGIYAYRPRGLATKMDWFVTQMKETGAVRSISDEIEPFKHAPIDATPVIVAEIKKRLGLARI